MTQRLLAEWEPQDAILLAWPHKNTPWGDLLDDVNQLFEALVSVICDYADVIIAIPESEIADVTQRLQAMDIPLEYVSFYPVISNDIWVRDFGPIAVASEHGVELLKFSFNGSGGKFATDLDNQVVQSLFSQQAFPCTQLHVHDVVLEGGSIDTDGNGNLLVTSSCLLNKNRNPQLSKTDFENQLISLLGISKVTWLNHGYLLGDTADGHIDTLARFCPNNTIVYTACDDEHDEHYLSLKNMEDELKSMTNSQGGQFRLLPLPWPGAVYGDTDQRLPVTYASFLVVNEAVLVPIYNVLSDEDALEVIAQAFPGYEIFGIPCATLIERGGSLHRVAMQLPEGTLMQAF